MTKYIIDGVPVEISPEVEAEMKKVMIDGFEGSRQKVPLIITPDDKPKSFWSRFIK
jgi:hypothetical protein